MVLGACAGAPDPGEHGGAQGELRRETAQLVETFGRSRLDCARLGSVHADAALADRPAPGVPPGAVREYWTVSGCRRRAVFAVTLVPEPDGGTSVEVEPVGEVREASCPADQSTPPTQAEGFSGRMARAGRNCP